VLHDYYSSPKLQSFQVKRKTSEFFFVLGARGGYPISRKSESNQHKQLAKPILSNLKQSVSRDAKQAADNTTL
jgi:hypothetical protein